MAVAPASPFQWVGNQAMTPAQAQEARSVAAALAGRRANVAQNGWEGLAQLANAFSERQWREQAGQAEAAGQASVAEALAGLSPQSGFSDIASVLSNPWVTESPGGSAIASALLQQNMQNADPLRQLQIETATEELRRLRDPQPTSDPTSAIQNYQFLVSQGVDPSQAQSMAFGGNAPVVNVNNGQPIPDVGTIPPGMMLRRDENGFPIEMVPIPNSQQDIERIAAEEATASKDTREQRTANVVVQDIDRALTQIEDNPIFTTGIGAQLTGGVGGSPAANVGELLNSVKANAGFAELQAMRDSSPTGGALGQVTERELAFLQSTIGSLAQSQSDDQLKDNLRRVKNAYLDIIHGPGQGPERERLSFEGDGEDGWQDMGGGIRIKPIGQ